MITTKAYIYEMPEKDSNIFKVNIPLMADNVNDEAIFDALLAVQSGTYNDYKVGDCVFVDFEDDKYNTAIILGKLYTDVPEENDAYGLFNQLNVTGSAVLPEDTKIGKYSTQDIFNLYQGVENGTGGSINPDDLKSYVQWTMTEIETQGETEEIYADHIRIMTGEEYDDYLESEDFDEELFNHTLYFLSSIPENGGYKIKDTVQTLDDLLSYDTLTLNNGDIIKVLSDSNHWGIEQLYRWDASQNSFINVDDYSKPDDQPLPDPTPDPSDPIEISFAKLASSVEGVIGKAMTDSGVNVSTKSRNPSDKSVYSYWFIGWRINKLCRPEEDKWYCKYIEMTPSGYESLPNSNTGNNGTRKKGEWAKYSSNETLKVGDVLVFKNNSIGYLGVVASSTECICSNNYTLQGGTAGKSAIVVKETIENVMSYTNSTDYTIVRYLKG